MRFKHYCNLFLAVGAFFLAGCCQVVIHGGKGGGEGEDAKKDTVTQISTIDALLAGVYDGSMPLAKLAQYGDTGIGTYDGLDGEMILLDGRFYQVCADGKVYTPASTVKTPFAAVSWFRPQKRYSLGESIDFAELCNRIDKWDPNRNMFLAIRIKGFFKTMKTRSVPRQSKPYPPLVEVTKTQPVFDLKDVSGTIVGYRLPSYVKGINVPGYHLHFISDDLKSGGHILGFEMREGYIELDELSRFYMLLPDGMEGFAGADLNKDRTVELHRAEK